MAGVEVTEMLEWFRSQIEHRKTVAHDAPIGPWSARAEGGARDPDEWSIMSEGDKVCGLLWEQAEADHIALNNPEDVIARCDAELAVLDGYATLTGNPDRLTDATLHMLWFTVGQFVRLLASGYRHRPGWREEWRP